MNDALVNVGKIKDEQKRMQSDTTATSSAITSFRNFAIGTLVLVLLVVGYAAFQAGSIGRALPYLNGQRVFVEQNIRLGFVRCGDELDVRVKVANYGSSSVSIVGARKNCGCIGIESFPVEVSAGRNHPLQLRFRVPEKQTPFVYTIELYIAKDGNTFRPLPIAISGVATE